MTPAQEQKRRRALYRMPLVELQKLYAKLSGHLLFEVKKMGGSDPVSFLVDVIVHREKAA